ncbi:MAG: hypothetical protein EVA65_00920 [Oceanococcus sp.]|nr:MAG: hypothetical protein EVA65_00920 [Oceanococcus sp.]
MCIRILTLVAACVTTPSYAGICDFRPSQQFDMSALELGVAAALPAVATNALASTFYVVPHASGAGLMLASTAAGTSAAGTIGFISGTLGTMSTAFVAVAISAPVVIGTVATAGGIAALESGCFLLAGDHQ